MRTRDDFNNKSAYYQSEDSFTETDGLWDLGERELLESIDHHI